MAAIHFGGAATGEGGRMPKRKGGKASMGATPGGKKHMEKRGALQTTFAKPAMGKK